MKIAFVGQKGIPHIAGGVETHVEHLAVELVRSGHDVVVYTRPHYVARTRTSYKGVELVSVPHIYTKYLDAASHTLLVCFALWRRTDVDIIHFQSIGPSLFIPLMRLLRPRTPIVATFHSQCYHHSKWGWFARKVLQLGEWMVCHMAHEVITVSGVLQEYVHMRYRRRAHYIPNGIHPATPVPARVIQERYGLTPDNYILAMARMIRTKRFHDLIDAYTALDTTAKLVIAYADAHDDDYRDRIRAAAATNPNIILIPYDEQTPALRAELFSHASVFVLPSDAEGLAITLLEAMSYGRAVVVSDIIENTSILNGTGKVFRVGDRDDLAATLRTLLDDPAARRALGARARAHVMAHFTWRTVARETAALYEKMLAQHAPARYHSSSETYDTATEYHRTA